MFKRLIICLFLAGAPVQLAAQTYQDSFISQLEAQGFSDISASRTWLGRVRLVAFRDDLRREIVFIPQTGEILRDYWREVDDDGTTTPRLINPGVSTGGSGRSDDDDAEDDNPEEDDDEEDEEDEPDEPDDEEDD